MENVETKEAARIKNMSRVFMKYKLVTFFILIIITHPSMGSMDNSIDCNEEYKMVNQFLSQQSVKNYNFAEYQSIDKKLNAVMPFCKKHAALNRSMAQVKISLGKNMEALAYADVANSVEPNNPEGIHLKGMIYSLIGNKDKSLELLKKSLTLEPNNIDFLVNYCSTLEMFSMYTEAVNACSKATEYNEIPPVVYYIRGRAHEALGDKKKANSDYIKAKELGFTIQE